MRRVRLSVMAIKLLSNIFENSKSLVVRTDYHIQTPCRTVIVARTLGGAVPRPLITGRDAFRFRRMWSFRNIAGGVLATLMLGTAFGASPSQAPKPAALPDVAIPPAKELPDAAGVVRAFSTLRRWVNSFDTPSLNDAASKSHIERGTAVCVILRWNGKAIGVGVDAQRDGAGDHQDGDLMLRRAAGKALNDAMGEPAIQSVTSQIVAARQQQQPTLDLEALQSELGRSLLIELEVAGELTPLIGKSIEHLARKLEPGLDGVAMRRGSQWVYLFPSQLRITNQAGDPQGLLLNLFINAGLPVKDFSDVAMQNDISLYRFRTMHLTQNSPAGMAFSTMRGDTLVSDADVTVGSIRALADGLVDHLLTSSWPAAPDEINPNGVAMPSQTPRKPLGLRGTYRTTADQYDPLIAPPVNQALAAMAIGRYAALADLEQPRRELAFQAFRELMLDLAQVTSLESDPLADPAACAMIVLAVSTQPTILGEVTIKRLFNEAVKKTTQSFEPAAGFVERTNDGAPPRTIPPHTQAIIASSMARLLTMPLDPPLALDARTVREALDAAWQSMPEPERVGLLPWIGWGESDWSAASGKSLVHADDLRLLFDALDNSRIGSADRPGPADLQGGFVFGVEKNGANAALPTDQSVRPAAWMAGAVGDARLVPSDRAAAALGRHLQTMRFLMQLSVRDTSHGRLRNPARAMAGIRAAIWDSDQAVPAQALGLITAVETLNSLAK